MTGADQSGKIAVVGGGAFGTALAHVERAAGRRVRLWARNPVTVAAINTRHANDAYLPGVRLAEGIEATDRLEDLADCGLVLLAAPAQHVREVTGRLAAVIAERVPVVVCAKGLERASGRYLADVLVETMPRAVPLVLSGPSFAEELARGLPTAVTLACTDAAVGQATAHALGSRVLRIYWTHDLVGVQLGGAVKNVLAIAAGIVEGRGLGASAHAALVTRGFAELRRFGLAHGAEADTLAGLSGLGDLVLTCSSAKSRNMSLGRELGRGRTLAEVLTGRHSVTEGVATAEAVARIARGKGIEMPIATAVAAILAGAVSIDDAIAGLLARPQKAEHA